MAFKIENLFFALFAFVLVMGFGYTIYSENLIQYDVSGDASKLGAISNELKQSYSNEVLDMKGKLVGEATSSTDAVDNMVKAGYTASRNNPFKVGERVLNITDSILKESTLVKNDTLQWVLISFLTIAIITWLIYLIMRFRTY